MENQAQPEGKKREGIKMKRAFAILAAIALAFAMLLPAAPAQAQSGNQWRIDYYPNTNWAGAPTYTQYANVINFNWGAGAPGPGMPNANWTSRMTTNAFFYAGTYRFTFLADDEIFVTMDGQPIVDTRGQGQSGKTFVVDVPMYQGNHNIQADFRQFGGGAYVSIDWQIVKGVAPVPPPQQPQQPVNPSQPSVQTQFGDYTPCIQQNIHQSNCFQSNGAWDSPNLGSIQTEPKIQTWENCKANSFKNFVVDQNTNPPTEKQFKCSKTEAGYFPN